MKKIIIISLILFINLSFAACGGKKETTTTAGTNAETIVKEAEKAKAENEKPQDTQKFIWPKEASALGVPELKKGKISAIGSTTGKDIVIGYSGLRAEDIEGYRKQIEKEGFSKGKEYPVGSVWNYVKNGNDGSVSITVAFTTDSGEASIAINPTMEKLDSQAKQSGGNLKWSDKLPKEIPMFTKGTLIESKDVAPLTIMIYKGVKPDEVEAYRKALTNAGFRFDEEDSRENNWQYEKEDHVEMTFILVGIEYKDEHLTLMIGKNQ